MKRLLISVCLFLVACSHKLAPEYVYPEGTQVCVSEINSFTLYTLLEDVVEENIYAKAYNEEDTTRIDTRLIVNLYQCLKDSTDGK